MLLQHVRSVEHFIQPGIFVVVLLLQLVDLQLKGVHLIAQSPILFHHLAAFVPVLPTQAIDDFLLRLFVLNVLHVHLFPFLNELRLLLLKVGILFSHLCLHTLHLLVQLFDLFVFLVDLLLDFLFHQVDYLVRHPQLLSVFHAANGLAIVLDLLLLLLDLPFFLIGQICLLGKFRLQLINFVVQLGLELRSYALSHEVVDGLNSIYHLLYYHLRENLRLGALSTVFNADFGPVHGDFKQIVILQLIDVLLQHLIAGFELVVFIRDDRGCKDVIYLGAFQSVLFEIDVQDELACLVDRCFGQGGS